MQIDIGRSGRAAEQYQDRTGPTNDRWHRLTGQMWRGVALSTPYPPTAKRSETIKGPNRVLNRFRGTTLNSVSPIIHNGCHAARKISVALPVSFAIAHHAPNRAE